MSEALQPNRQRWHVTYENKVISKRNGKRVEDWELEKIRITLMIGNRPHIDQSTGWLHVGPMSINCHGIRHAKVMANGDPFYDDRYPEALL
jgi:hypothetical protein